MSQKKVYRCQQCGYETDVYEGRGFMGQQIVNMSCPDCKRIVPLVVGGVIGDAAPSFNCSQLLVTTHYDPILKDIDDIFGKDSVWFTEKEKDGNSSLYSLIDFRGLNKLSSIHRAYMNGQFGALPNVIKMKTHGH